MVVREKKILRKISTQRKNLCYYAGLFQLSIFPVFWQLRAAKAGAFRNRQRDSI
jgi:hypothetical protein